MTRKKGGSKASRLHLTDRSLNDIAGIEQYSIQKWGKRTTAKYLAQVEDALALIERNPGILQQKEGFHPSFKFYKVNRHVLVFDINAGDTVLLTMFHGSMDIPSRLAELEPTLATEVKLLQQKLRQK